MRPPQKKCSLTLDPFESRVFYRQLIVGILRIPRGLFNSFVFGSVKRQRSLFARLSIYINNRVPVFFLGIEFWIKFNTVVSSLLVLWLNTRLSKPLQPWLWLEIWTASCSLLHTARVYRCWVVLTCLLVLTCLYDTNVCIYICMYIYLCVYVYIYVCTYIYTYVYIHLYTYLCDTNVRVIEGYGIMSLYICIYIYI